MTDNDTLIDGVTFSTVIEFLREGNNIAWRKGWTDEFIHVKNIDNIESCFVKKNAISNDKNVFIPSFSDIFAEDWIIQMFELSSGEVVQQVEEPEKLELVGLDGSVEILEKKSEVIEPTNEKEDTWEFGTYRSNEIIETSEEEETEFHKGGFVENIAEPLAKATENTLDKYPSQLSDEEEEEVSRL